MSLDTMNDVAVSWSDVKVSVSVPGGPTLPNIDLKSINHESKLDRGEQRKGGRVHKRTTGQSSNSADCTFYSQSFIELCTALAEFAPQNEEGDYQLSKVPFDIIVIFSLEGETEIQHKEFLGCHVDKDSEKAGEGTDAQMVDVDLGPKRIVRVLPNGKRVVLL